MIGMAVLLAGLAPTAPGRRFGDRDRRRRRRRG